MPGDEEVRYFGGEGKLPLGTPHHYCVHPRVSERVRGGTEIGRYQMTKQGPDKHCRKCRHWYSQHIDSGEPNKVGLCCRTIHIKGRETPVKLFHKTKEHMSCGEWEPKGD